MGRGRCVGTVIVIAVVFTMCSCSDKSSDAFEAFKKFGNAVVGIKGNAGDYADGAVLVQVQKYQAWLTQFYDKAFFALYERNIEQWSKDGRSVTLVVKQKVKVDPPGQNTVMGSSFGTIEYTVTMMKTDGGWKVVTFKAGPIKSDGS